MRRRTVACQTPGRKGAILEQNGFRLNRRFGAFDCRGVFGKKPRSLLRDRASAGTARHAAINPKTPDKAALLPCVHARRGGLATSSPERAALKPPPLFAI